jgi:hypothetical protein
MLSNHNYINLEENPDYEFIPGDRYVIFEREAYEVIVKHQNIHIGPRREGFHEMTKCPYLILRNGVVFKFRYIKYDYQIRWPTKEGYDELSRDMKTTQRMFKDAKLATGITQKDGKNKGKPWYRLNFREPTDMSNDTDLMDFLTKEEYVKPQPKIRGWKLIREVKDIVNSFRYFTSQDIGRRFGLDFETSGFPVDDKDFFHMGVGIADQVGVCAYYDMERMQSNEDKSSWDTFLKYFKEFLDKHASECYTYNVSFEMRATYLLFKRLYPFQDSIAINKVDGDLGVVVGDDVKFEHTLKYTAMKDLGVASWDDDFDWLKENLKEMMEGIWDKKKGRLVREPSTPENYELDPVWVQIELLFPNEILEFKRLFKKYWGSRFKCIPANILGFYCCQDSYYTLLLRFKASELGYLDKAWEVFNNNLRLSAHLDITGAYIDEPYRKWMENYEANVIAYGSINVVKSYISIELDELKDIEIPDIPHIIDLLKHGIDIINPKEFIWGFFNEGYKDGVDTDLSDKLLGREMTLLFVATLKREAPKLDNSLSRKRKIFLTIYNKLFVENWGFVEVENELRFKIGGKDYKLNKKDLPNIIKKCRLISQLKEVDHYIGQLNSEQMISEFESLDGQKKTAREVILYSSSILNLSSPKQWDPFLIKYYNRYKDIICGVSFDNIGNLLHASEVKLLAKRQIVDLEGEKLTKFVFEKPCDMFSEYVRNQDKDLSDWFSSSIDKIDISGSTVQGYFKFCVCYRLAKKYGKLNSTYTNGMLGDAVYCLPMDENGISAGRWGEGTEYKVFPKYQVCQKKSKRWSSNFHTIPKDSEVKRAVTTPPGYLLSYFDISALEVRTIAKMSGDEFLLNSFAQGKDPYIELSKVCNPNKDDNFHLKMRPIYKTALLGVCYGIGAESLGVRIQKSTKEAEKIIDDLFANMRGVKKFIDSQIEYTNKTGGDIRMLLQDKLNVGNLPKDKWPRVATNWCIQGGSAILMGDAFENIIQTTIDEGKVKILPLNVVHDSCQNYFESNFIFDLHPYYYKLLSDYLFDKHQIRYEFDTEIGTNYCDKAKLKQINSNELELVGNCTTLTKLCNKLTADRVRYKIDRLVDYKGEECQEMRPDIIQNTVRQFFEDFEPRYEFDMSKYKLIIKRGVS